METVEQHIKAIIMTVGLPGDQGGDVLDALWLDLEALRPEVLVLLATSQSMPNARRMIERSGLPAERCEIVELTTAHDLDEAFRQTNDAIDRIIARGYAPDQIAVNYTSGTKVMGSGAVLSAVYQKIMQLRYITGLASVREGGRSRHRILTTRPGAIFAYQQLLLGRTMLHDLRFAPAHQELAGIDDAMLDPEDRRLRQDLMRLARAYGEWDHFFPDRFLAGYAKVKFEQEDLAPYRLGEGGMEAVMRVAQETAAGRPGPFIITDLYDNAIRRWILGRVDDALARLYRALEMFAQWILLRDHSIDTNDVDTRRIPPRDRVAFEALRSHEDGLVKIGLRKAYDLLIILNAPVGVHFREDPVMRAFLEDRGQSILAHGMRPADDRDCQRFMANAAELFKVEIKDFTALSTRLQFPWLVDAATGRTIIPPNLAHGLWAEE